ncbi:hypothetical protein [Planomicrobium sp. CPCC 101079]|uniref:hypothetical protein n=1 Tax=Planomicrobium sp. CPCC 101079 TaxID=2599618 RepID=UPI0011B3DC9C|nr:hypothetical protein [Planomicrobium sp. CPCC 101079]TWT00945.1 hypothetical protein FQV28_16265 [Planomicrobium sp. CPCC 101079]
MKHIYTFEDIEEYEKHQDIIQRFSERLNEYQLLLEEEYALVNKPKGVVWTSAEVATSIFSELPIPAFTNKDTIYITPDVKAWRKLFIQQLDGNDLPHIERFYEQLSENHILTILGHELTHHSNLFLDDFGDEREDGIWFEEGMCEYLSRKFLLTADEFETIAAIEKELVNVFTEAYGDRSLDEFGSNSYAASLSSIMFDYWRSFLAIKYLVEDRYDNNIQAVFEEYHKWDIEGRILSLTEHFGLDKVSI